MLQSSTVSDSITIFALRLLLHWIRTWTTSHQKEETFLWVGMGSIVPLVKFKWSHSSHPRWCRLGSSCRRWGVGLSPFGHGKDAGEHVIHILECLGVVIRCCTSIWLWPLDGRRGAKGKSIRGHAILAHWMVSLSYKRQQISLAACQMSRKFTSTWDKNDK